jgi:hypothetical protein
MFKLLFNHIDISSKNILDFSTIPSYTLILKMDRI